MGEHQVPVQPGSGAERQRRTVHLAGGDHHLLPALVLVLPQGVAVDSRRRKAIEDPQLLQLAVGGQQWLAVPQANVAQGGRTGLHIGTGQPWGRIDITVGDAIELEGQPGEPDRMGQVGLLTLELLGVDHQQLQHGLEHQFQQRNQQRCAAKTEPGRRAPTMAGQRHQQHQRGQQRQQGRQRAQRQGQVHIHPTCTRHRAPHSQQQLMTAQPERPRHRQPEDPHRQPQPV